MMSRATFALSPQIGVAVFAALALTTLSIDAYHARPLIKQWLEARQEAPLSRVERSHAFGDLPVSIETSAGARMNLGATNGRVRIVTMFYAHCPTMCPMTVDAIQRIDRSLTASEREQLGVVLLSLDPARDSPDALREFGSERGVDPMRWLIARTTTEDVRRVAQSLGISYRNLSGAVVDHSSTLVLLDARGHEVTRSEIGSASDASFISAVRQALADERT
jgi:protein SCO1/2